MPCDDNEKMREFMLLAEAYADVDAVTLIEGETIEVDFRPADHPLLADLRDVVFRMRAFCEAEGGDFGLGVETGLQRAADMIENVIRRHTQGE